MRGVELEMLGVERDELGASQRGGESEQQQRPVAATSEVRRVDRLEQPLERVEIEQRGAARRSGRVPCSRRIPDITASTAPESQGFGWSWARCAAAIAAARRATVTARNPRSASAATLAGVAGIAGTPRDAHQVANPRQSVSYVRRVAGASAPAAYASARLSSRSSSAGASADRGAGRGLSFTITSDNDASRYLIRQAVAGPPDVDSGEATAARRLQT